MNLRKLSLFIGLAYGIAWGGALMAHLAGLRYGTIPGLAFIALVYMPAPAFATIIIQKVLYRGSLAGYGLRVRGLSWPWLLGSLAMVWVILLTTLAFIALFGHGFGIGGFGRLTFDPSEVAALLAGYARRQLGAEVAVEPPPIPPILLLPVILIGGSLNGALFNLPFALGEELGWRGLMLRETQPLGFWRSNLFTGTVWGFWHAPIIVQGHNYPGYPVAGIGMMVLFCIAISFPLAYSRLKTRSIFGPAVFHAAFNAVGLIPAFYVAGGHPLLGSVTGAAGIVALLLLTAAITRFDRPLVASYATSPS